MNIQMLTWGHDQLAKQWYRSTFPTLFPHLPWMLTRFTSPGTHCLLWNSLKCIFWKRCWLPPMTVHPWTHLAWQVSHIPYRAQCWAGSPLSFLPLQPAWQFLDHFSLDFFTSCNQSLWCLAVGLYHLVIVGCQRQQQQTLLRKQIFNIFMLLFLGCVKLVYFGIVLY